MFTAAVDGDIVWLAVIAALNTMASVFYYLRWIAPVFRRLDTHPAAETPAVDVLSPNGRWATISAHAAAAVSRLLGVASGAVLAVLGITLPV